MSAAALSRPMDELRQHWPGLLLAAVVAFAASFIADTRGGPTLLYALLLGMALNSVSADGPAKPGIDFAARRVLRLGVALLGVRITLAQIAGVGWYGGSLLALTVLTTIGFGIVFSRTLGLPRRLGLLTGGATAICGASAAIAIASVLPRHDDDGEGERELVFTVAGVTVLSTLAMILYPVITAACGLSPKQAGVFLGGTIHDVAQVVGAGYSVSHEAGDYAVLTKMLRVAMLLPVVTAVSLALRRRQRHAGGERRRRDPLLPNFLLGFVALVALGSAGLIPPALGEALNAVSRACLVLAIAAVGLKTSLLEVRKVGRRAVVLLVAEALFLAGLVLLLLKLN